MRRGQGNLRFRLRLLLGMLLPAVIMVSLLEMVFVDRYMFELERNFEKRGEAIARQFIPIVNYALFTGNTEAVRQLAMEVHQSDKEITAITVHDAVGRVLVQEGERGPIYQQSHHKMLQVWHTDALTLVQMPVFRSTLPLGDEADAEAFSVQRVRPQEVAAYIEVELLRSGLDAARNEILQLTLIILVLGVMVSVVVSLWIAGGIVAPIEEMTRTVQAIGRGDMAARLKPDPSSVLVSLEDGINDMADRLERHDGELRGRIDEATAALLKEKETAERLARTDTLTGLANRRAFAEQAEHEILRALRYSAPMSVVLADIDHFKQVNDKYGHQTGDAVLVRFAGLLRDAVREVDFVGRWGGEEFVVLLPGTALPEAIQAAERMRAAACDPANAITGVPSCCTASFGVAELSEDDPTLDEMVARADAALYRAKENGRNRVEAAAPNPPEANEAAA